MEILSNLFRSKRRGLIHIEAEGGVLLNNGDKYNGMYEVIIEEETTDMYKIRYIDHIFQNSAVADKWVNKKLIKLLN